MKNYLVSRLGMALLGGQAFMLPVAVKAQFSFTTNSGVITITGYDTAAGLDVVIPASINGYPVTRIRNFAFYLKTTITTVTIPNSVTSIGKEAFFSCSGLTSVMIPNSVTNLGVWAFASCSGLTNIAVAVANPSYASADGVLFNKTLTDLLQYPGGLTGSYTIPNSVTSIGDSAFSFCSGLTNVVIGNSVTSLGTNAFGYCSGLTSVTIPNSVTSLGDWAFFGCSGLTNVVIGNSVTSIGYQTFYHCFGLTNVTIPNSVTSLGNSTFAYCYGLHQAYFQGNAPLVNGGAGSANSTVFYGGTGTVYYVAGTTGWGSTFGGWPTARWYKPQPQILDSPHGLAVQSNQFQFTISWATNTSVVVEASTNLLNWTPVSTNTLIAGTNGFSDPNWTNYPQRFYRVRSQ